MKAFRDWKLEQKLFSGFGIILALILAVGIYTMYACAEIQRCIRETETRDFNAVELGTQLNEITLKTHIAFLDHSFLMNQDDYDRIAVLKEKFLVLCQEFKKLEKANVTLVIQLEHIEDDYKQYVQAGLEIVRKISEKKTGDVNDYLILRDIEEEIYKEVERFKGEFISELSMSLGVADTMAADLRIIYFFLMGMSLLSGLVITYRLTRRIVNPLRRLVTAYEHVSKGEFDCKTEMESQDELGQLVNAFNTMTRNLRQTTVSKDELQKVVDELENEIFERKKTERLLKRTVNEWNTTFNAMSDIVCLLDENGVIIQHNQKLQKFFGKEDVFIAGNACADVLNLCLEKGENCPFRLAKQSLKRETATFAREDRVYLEIIDPLIDENGKFNGAVMVISDITSSREIEKKQRLVQLGKLVADMAHEVNNPLMVVSGRAQLSLMQDIKDEEIRNNLKTIFEQSQRAKDIIQRMLKFSRPSQGEYREVMVINVIEGVLMLIEHQFKLANIGVKRSYAKDTPLIMADDKQLQEVFMNIFNNAADAMPKGGIIEINTALENNFLRVEIKDTGKGMSEDVLRRLFDPFFTTKEKGTGLGLAICQNIVKAHGGTLKYESAVGRGTKAIILLPASKK